MSAPTSGSLAGLAAYRAETDPDATAIFTTDGGETSYRQLSDAAARTAGALRHRGVGPADRVLLAIGNSVEMPASLLAIWSIGASAVLVHPATPEDQRAEVASLTGAAVTLSPHDVLARPDWGMGGDPLVVPLIADDAEAVIVMTSGSTGKPKGVPLAHAGAWTTLRATVAGFRGDTDPDERAHSGPPNLLAQPVSHTAGLIRLLFGLYVGRPVVLMAKFDPGAARDAIVRHGIPQLALNPSMMRMLLDLPAGVDLGPVRYVSSGTAPLPESLRLSFEERFGIPVLQTYGQTEAFGALASERVRDVLSGRRRPGSVGRALPGVELRVVDDAGEPVGAGGDGHLLARTASASRGYVGGSAERTVDAEGWLHTGDIGHLDDDGYLYLTSRAKNVLIVGGFNVFPEEIEAAVAAAGWPDAVVVGMPDERLGEVPVVAYAGVAEPSEVLAATHDLLAAFKRPRRAVRFDTLPVTPLGKPDRPRVAALVREGEAVDA